MNPILLGKQVEDGLKDLVRSNFETTSPAFEGMIEEFLEKPENFIKGPWLSLDMPFRPASSDSEPFPDVPLGFRPHKHQELAFDRLRGTGAKSTLVATGTGSGKTECYLWPILDACRENKDQPGIKAIIIYPMNALATDQSRRVAKAIHKISALQGVRCGIYADSQPYPASDAMSETDVITRREEMRQNPPDILLTNYKMLDYLLLRGKDKRLWSQNSPSTLRYLVVDELHTFDGAQGADLALLIRRLKARLATPKNHLVCIGSSATLGTAENIVDRLIQYAEAVFGEDFDSDSVIQEQRLKTHEYLKSIEFTDFPEPSALTLAVEEGLEQSQADAAATLEKLFFERFDPDNENFDNSVELYNDPASDEWRVELGSKLFTHIAFHRVLEAVQAVGKAPALDRVVDELAGGSLFKLDWDNAQLEALVKAVVILTSWARRDVGGRIQPLIHIRVQIWVREMARMVASLPKPSGTEELQPATLYHSDDLEETHLGQTLPVVVCQQCGTSGLLCRLSERGNSLWAPRHTLYREFFGLSDRVRFLYFEEIQKPRKAKDPTRVAAVSVNPKTLQFKLEDAPEPKDRMVPAWLYSPIDERRHVNKTCPFCGTESSLQILGLRSARLTSALSTVLFNSNHHEESDDNKPRVLVFSDSVQDAAHRAAVTEIRNVQTVFQKLLYNLITQGPERSLSLDVLCENGVADLRGELSDANFIAKYIARDQIWRRPYVDLVERDQEPTNMLLVNDVARRLGWEFFSDLTFRSRTSRTLDALGICVADVPASSLTAAARDFQLELEKDLGKNYRLDETDALAFLAGVTIYMRRVGAITHPYLQQAVERGTATKGPNYYAALAALNLRKRGVLPRLTTGRTVVPRFPTLRSRVQGFQFVGRDRGTNWYRAWINRFFGRSAAGFGTSYTDIYQQTFEILERHSIAQKLSASGRKDPVEVWALCLEKVAASADLVHLRCNKCGRRESFAAKSAENVTYGCMRIGCDGHLEPTPPETIPYGPTAYTKNILETERNHRVVAREHTGILKADDRRRIEKTFIEGEDPWHPNLISATSTLEMGIDIGDLSTLILSSMPPEEANYVQRIGRTGRRDGSSLNLALIAAKRHDLQFWEEPESMLAGEVTPPGVHLEAIAILRRQAAAFALDKFVAESTIEIEYGKVNAAITALERSLQTEFPFNWFAHLKVNAEAIAKNFISDLPDHVRMQEPIVRQIGEFLTSGGEDGVRYRVKQTFDAVANERTELLDLQKELDIERRRLKNESPPPTDLEEQLNDLKERRAQISAIIKETIDEVEVIKFMTDQGLLPNYAFPEEGVKLRSVITRTPEVSDDQGNNRLVPKAFEYSRGAASALTELAPGQTFYAEGRQVKIDKVDRLSEGLADWRYCPDCTYAELNATGADKSHCPRCGSQMWSDSGSRRETFELRLVGALTSERDASIRDQDDRDIDAYDRDVFPNYAVTEIEVAYGTSGGEVKNPFGYEFIPKCDFRDINFGPKNVYPSNFQIAGQNRASRPFLICRHCGMHQTDVFDQDRAQKPGKHIAGCPSQRGEITREEWEIPIFLMRRFTTEALKLVVPVVVRAQDDEISSFVAAIELGLKKHFAGRADHVRSTVVQEFSSTGVGVKNLYLYDTIPGGSGYLRQLANNTETFQSVFLRSAETLRNCVCVDQDDKNGCFRCVKSYRSQFTSGEPKRDVALQLVEAVLNDWDKLEKVSQGINEALGAEFFESELEARFLDALKHKFGSESLKPIILENGQRGFQLSTNAQGQEFYWRIEQQVQINEHYSELPQRRVDFVLSIAGDSGVKPIVVELDGWEFHARKIENDVETRLRMIKSGQVEVWTLTWDDFETSEPPPNPFRSSTRDSRDEQLTDKLLTKYQDLARLRSSVERLRNCKSLDALFARLSISDWEPAKAAVLHARVSIGPTGEAVEKVARWNLSENASLFIEEANLFGMISDQGLRIFLGLSDDGPLSIVDKVSDARFVLQADIAPDFGDRNRDKNELRIWRGMWRCINLLQNCDGLHVVLPDLQTLEPSLTQSSTLNENQSTESDWQEVFSLVEESLFETVKAFRDEGLPIPDMIGEDLMIGDVVAGTIELGWKNAGFAITLEPLAVEGWKIAIVHFPGTPEFPEFLRRVTSAVSGG